VCVWLYIYIYIYVNVCVCVCACVCVLICTYMYMHIYTYVHAAKGLCSSAHGTGRRHRCGVHGAAQRELCRRGGGTANRKQNKVWAESVGGRAGEARRRGVPSGEGRSAWSHSRASDGEGTPCTGRPGRRRRRGRAAVVQPIALLRCGNRCTVAMNGLRCAAFATGCTGAVVGCNGRHSVATGCAALQQMVMGCNRWSCAATDCARCAAAMLLRCGAITATGCNGLLSVATDCRALQPVALPRNRWCCCAVTLAALRL
jgi:hypothetical protein